jgi:integrase/recombinase XerC
MKSNSGNGYAWPSLSTALNERLEAASDDFLVHIRAAGRSALTVASYSESLALLKELLGRATALRSISPKDLNEVVANLAAPAGQRSFRRSETTVNRHRSAYRTFFRWAFQSGRINANPAMLLRRSPAESIPAAPVAIAEVNTLLSCIRTSADPLRVRDEALFATYAFAGLRRNEALDLNVYDYDPYRRVLHVRNGKGKRSRTVPLVSRLDHLLSQFRDHRVARLGAAGRLFNGRTPGSGLAPRQVQRRFEYWRARAGLRANLTIHSFRAGFATALHKRCRDVVLVSRALGHRDLRATLRYIDPWSVSLSRAMEDTFVPNKMTTKRHRG